MKRRLGILNVLRWLKKDKDHTSKKTRILVFFSFEAVNRIFN